MHLAAVQSFGIEDPRPYGFDAAVEFPPHPFGRRAGGAKVRRLQRGFQGVLENYESLLREMLRKPPPDYRWYRGLTPSWDNTARRGPNAYVAVGSTPELYRLWLGELALQMLSRDGTSRSPFYSSTRGTSGPRATTSSPASAGVTPISRPRGARFPRRDRRYTRTPPDRYRGPARRRFNAARRPRREVLRGSATPIATALGRTLSTSPAAAGQCVRRG